MKSDNNQKIENPKRREFMINLPLAAAALTLNSAFGLPTETAMGKGRLFLKIGGYMFSPTDLELLQSGRMESFVAEVEVSVDKIRWQTLKTSITDKRFISQLTELARNT